MQISFGDLFQILLLSVALYYIFNLFRGTRSAQMLFGLLIITVVLVLTSGIFGLEVLGWILRQMPMFLAFTLFVIFQPEIRQALAVIGRRRSTIGATHNSAEMITNCILEVTSLLSSHRYGALIAIERQIHLDGYSQNGTQLNAPLVTKLLASFFYPNTPLHDGGVIIRGETIVAARCIFPLSASDTGRGTRHRAALGLSEETDAIIVVVSEETGDISIACQGRLIFGLSQFQLKKYLRILIPQDPGFTETLRRVIDNIEEERLAENKSHAKGATL